MTEDKAFELQIRQVVDQKFDRDPVPDSPWTRFHNGQLSREECRALYHRNWPFVMAFNRVVMARLIETAPNFHARMEILGVIYPEFGTDQDAAHPMMYKKFLLAMGVPESQLGWDYNWDTIKEWNYEWRNMSWPEILAFTLFGETFGPVVMEHEAQVLRETYGMSMDSIEYFAIHSVHDKKDTEIILALLRKELRTEPQRKAFFDVLNMWFERARPRACRLPGTTNYRYVRRFDRRA